MAKSKIPKKEELHPQKDAVKKMRERFNQRKSQIRPSSEMDEIVDRQNTINEKPLPRAAIRKDKPDLGLL